MSWNLTSSLLLLGYSQLPTAYLPLPTYNLNLTIWIRKRLSLLWESWRNVRKFFKEWYQWVIRCRLVPVKKVARMLKRRLDRILSWFRHHISNGMAEGYNSRTQSIKTAARGFRNFANYRTRILFFCGKLNLLTNSTQKNVRWVIKWVRQ